jgi:hypothetical protein
MMGAFVVAIRPISAIGLQRWQLPSAQIGLLLLLLCWPALMCEGRRAELISQSVTELPAPPPPPLVEAYQLELERPSMGVSMALNFQDLLQQKHYGNHVDRFSTKYDLTSESINNNCATK